MLPSDPSGPEGKGRLGEVFWTSLQSKADSVKSWGVLEPKWVNN